MGVRFYLNSRSKADRKEVGVILAALRGRSQVKVMTPLRVKPSAWARKQQRVRASVPGAAEINGALARLKADAERLLLDCPTDDELREALRARLGKATVQKETSLLEHYEQFLDHKRARYKPGTVQGYEILGRHVERFLGAPAASVRPSDVGPGWLDDFGSYLVETGIQNVTTNKLVSRAKGFLRWLVERDALDRLPTSKPLPEATNFAVYLSTRELAALAALELAEIEGIPQRGYQAARDLFIVGAVTGQRYADLQGMRWDDLRMGGDGAPQTWMLYVAKTNTTLPVPLPAPARAVIGSQRGKARPLPKLSNQKANAYLKEVCRLAGLDEPVTLHKMKGGRRESETMPKHEAVSMHTARRTFITLALQSGLSINELLGHTHSDLKSLKVYAGQDQARLRRALHEAFDDLGPGGSS